MSIAPLHALRCARPFLIALAAAAAGAPGVHAAPAPDAEGLSAGIELRLQAQAGDLGLPVYPGATPRPDAEGEKNAITLAIWGGSLGFQLVAMKLQSDEPLERVARYYQRELGRYGTVLDCSAPRPPATKGDDDKVLSCDSDAPKADARQYKAGVPRHHRVVVLKTQGSQVWIDLARVDFGR